MKRTSLIALLFAALIGLASCVKEDLPGRDLHAGMGRIDLSLGGEELFIETKTATAVSCDILEHVVFTISGQTKGGVDVPPTKVYFDWDNRGNGTAYFKAGTYTLTAEYIPQDAQSGAGKLCYSGISAQFVVDVAGIAYLKEPFDTDGTVNNSITVNMTPSNAKVIVKFDKSMLEFYSGSSVDFSAPRSFSVSSADASTDEGGNLIIEAYLPDNQAAAYGIQCTPRTGSGAKTVNLTGLSLNGGAALQKGQSYAITVSLIPGGVAIFLDGSSTPIATTATTWSGLFS